MHLNFLGIIRDIFGTARIYMQSSIFTYRTHSVAKPCNHDFYGCTCDGTRLLPDGSFDSTHIRRNIIFHCLKNCVEFHKNR